MNELLARLSGVLQSPAVQGVAGAAALGANPLLGLVAAPALAQSRRRAEREDSAAKLELEARTEALTQARSQRMAQERLPAILAEVAGAQPPSMVGPPVPPAVAQNRLLATLSQAAPAQFTQAAVNRALPQSTRPPADLALMQALGFDMTPEGYAAFQAAGGQSQSDVLQDLLRAFQIRALQREEDTATRKESERVEAKATDEAVEAAQAEGLAKEARTVFDQLDNLEGTLLDAGSSDIVSSAVRTAGGVAGTVLSAFGVPAGQEIRSTNADRDEFEKSLSRLRNAAVDQLVPEGATNKQREEAAEGFPTADMEPEAVRSGIRAFAEEQVRLLEAAGVNDSAVQHFRELLEMMDSVTVEFDDG